MESGFSSDISPRPSIPLLVTPMGPQFSLDLSQRNKLPRKPSYPLLFTPMEPNLSSHVSLHSSYQPLSSTTMGPESSSNVSLHNSYQPLSSTTIGPELLDLRTQLSDAIHELYRRILEGCAQCNVALTSLGMAVLESSLVCGSVSPCDGSQVHPNLQQKIVGEKLMAANLALSACNNCVETSTEATPVALGMGHKARGRRTISRPTPTVRKITKAKQRDNKIKAMLDRVKTKASTISGGLSPESNLSWFYEQTATDFALAAMHPTAEGLEKIIFNLATKIFQRSMIITENKRFLIACLCKVLDFHGVSVIRVMRMISVRGKLTDKTIERTLHAVVWAARLLERLHWCGWGHQGLDLLLFCKSMSSPRFETAS